jgi:NodT family efflux transporter outer membrane factor (OMF) lipoprotein
MSRSAGSSAALIALTLAGCAAGPDFNMPAASDVTGYTATPMPSETASSAGPLGEAQRFSDDIEARGEWWRAFGSARLDALVAEGLENSPTLASSEATLRQARELYAAKSGSTQYPRLGANLSAERKRFNPGSLGQSSNPTEFSLYNAGVGVDYQLDLAGANRRALESLAAKADYQRYELEAARLTLAGNIVTAALTEARLTAQIAATEEIIRRLDEQLAIARERLRLGQASPDEVSSLETDLERTRAGLPILRQQRQENDHLLAVLVGRAPAQGGAPAFTLAEFSLPADLQFVLPSDLVRRRPDIQAAEALLHAANADYGVAVAKLYPQINLSANLGSQALTTGALFGGGSAIWNVVGQLTQPLFDAGLPAEKRAALAAFDAAASNYQNVVLLAFRNVADVLCALENDAERLAALARADAAAEESVLAKRRRYALGAASYVELLIAEQAAAQVRIDLIGAQAQRLVDSAAFYQAMGAGASVQEASN